MFKQNGFTLIELLAAILIIGVLSSVVLVTINPQQRIAQANDTKRIADLKQLASSLEAYRVKYSKYPHPCSQYNPGSCDSFNGGFNWIPGLVENDIIKSLPVDPKNTGFASVFGDYLSYFYISETNPAHPGTVAGEYFILGAWLENENDERTLDNLGGLPDIRPDWPGCNGDDIFMDGNIFIIRSYTCPGDPEGSL